jgi:hypothetical protein
MVLSNSGLTPQQQDSILMLTKNFFARFENDIEVTMDKSVFDAADQFHKIEVVETQDASWYGSAGGTAMIGSYKWGDGTPCFVFTMLLSYNTKYIAFCSGHEPGHTLSLRHQSVYDINCVKISEYRYSISPDTSYIMGGTSTKKPYWIIGQNAVNCTTIQDDTLQMKNFYK